MSRPSDEQTDLATTGVPSSSGAPLSSASGAALRRAYQEALPPPPAPVPELLPGTRLGGRYEIVGTLGRGGMGIVYEACNTNVEHIRYAIKTLIPGQPQADAAHFIQEAKRASKIRSRHVVKIFDFSVDDASHLTYMVMDYIGEDLEKFIRRHGNTLPAVQAVDFCMQVCEALIAAHAEKVVHRDIKPLNCLLRVDDGRETVVVTDFGIARDIISVAASGGGTGLDSAWTAIGTPGYIAPEVWLREARADHRVDIYSVGAMLFRILTGSVPPLAPKLEELHHSAIPEALLPVIRTALARAPKDRYPSARALQAALREVLPTLKAPGHAAHSPQPPRIRGLIAVTVLLAGAVATLFTWLFLAGGPAAPTAAIKEPLLPRETAAPITDNGRTVPGEAPAPAPPATAVGDPDPTPTDGRTEVPAPVGSTSDRASSETPTKAVPKPVVPDFADRQDYLKAAIMDFCQAKDGVLACVAKLNLKKSGNYSDSKLETMLYFKFVAGARSPMLESREPRLRLRDEPAFKTCVETNLRTWRKIKLVATRDGGEVSCPVAL